jgi:hypothetical protein
MIKSKVNVKNTLTPLPDPLRVMLTPGREEFEDVFCEIPVFSVCMA